MQTKKRCWKIITYASKTLTSIKVSMSCWRYFARISMKKCEQFLNCLIMNAFSSWIGMPYSSTKSTAKILSVCTSCATNANKKSKYKTYKQYPQSMNFEYKLTFFYDSIHKQLLIFTNGFDFNFIKWNWSKYIIQLCTHNEIHVNISLALHALAMCILYVNTLTDNSAAIYY